MKKGDTVIAKGDHWITKGSVGQIIGTNKSYQDNFLVLWQKVVPEHRKNIKSYHKSKDLSVITDFSDPNIAFRMRKLILT